MSKPTSEEQSGGHGTTELGALVRPRFVFSIRVGWADCDPAHIAYTGRIPYFALEAIDAWWEATTHQDWYQLNIDKNIGNAICPYEYRIPFPRDTKTYPRMRGGPHKDWC